jgi:hypothetical protein
LGAQHYVGRRDDFASGDGCSYMVNPSANRLAKGPLTRNPTAIPAASRD